MSSDGISQRSRPVDGLMVEFIGVTGVGKTTLVAAVKGKLQAAGYAVREGQEMLVAAYFGTGFRRWPKVQSLAAHLLALPPFVGYLLSRDGRKLSRLAARLILQRAGRPRIAVSLLRNFVKRIGTHLLLARLQRRLAAPVVILCDEGALQAAHNLFVHVGSVPQPEEIALFAALVPKPDLLVCVTAPDTQSIACILQRGHPRVDATPAAARVFVARAILAFDALCTHETLQGRLLVIDNTASDPMAQAVDTTAGRIAALLTRHLGPIPPDGRSQGRLLQQSGQAPSRDS